MTATPQPLMDTQPYVALDLEYNQPSGTIISQERLFGTHAKERKFFLLYISTEMPCQLKQ